MMMMPMTAGATGSRALAPMGTALWSRSRIRPGLCGRFPLPVRRMVSSNVAPLGKRANEGCEK